ncbi:MAG TPA: hypothetical protein VN033_07085 [Vulgatibacter sp.]|nr:hypothetical protein [Vulgatibacter sp.]
MKKARMLFLALLLGASSAAEAAPVRQPSVNALGFMLGGPTGISFKHWFGGSDAFDVGVGAGPGLRLHADYLWGIAQLLSNTSDMHLDFYVGAGGVVGLGGHGWCGWYEGRGRCANGAYLGARVPVGLDLGLRRAPVNFGFELAPGVAISSHRAGGLVDAFLFGRVRL